jgi:hypothetical protein
MQTDFVFKFYKSNITEKRKLLRQILTANNFLFYENSFISSFGIGCNFIIMPEMATESSILISAHYDGMGIFDNCGGTLQLLDLIESRKKQKSNSNITYILTDLEEYYQQGMYQYTLSSFFTKPKFHLNIDGIGIGDKLLIMPYENFSTSEIFQDKALITDNRIISKMGIPSFQSFTLDCCDFTYTENEIKFCKSLENYLDEKWLLSKSQVYNSNIYYTDKYNLCIDDIFKNNFQITKWIY